MLTDEQRAQAFYQAACARELEVCPHCETWLRSECENGLGCPTEDGMNGAILRAYREVPHD